MANKILMGPKEIAGGNCCLTYLCECDILLVLVIFFTRSFV
jgi:hypothetical protein